MSKELNIPIYRAKKIDSDEYIKGSYVPDSYGKNGYIIENTEWSQLSAIDGSTINCLEEDSFIEIDPSTLEISFDNGENFDSFSFVARAIEDHREATGI